MSDRTPLIAGNWKMYKTLAEARALAREIRRGTAGSPRPEVALAPPYTALAAVAAELAGSPIALAAQDTFWERQGAYTGAISPLMLLDAGCRYVIVGHSERRQHFGETNHTVNLKLKAVLAAGLRLHHVRGRNPGGAGKRPDYDPGGRAAHPGPNRPGRAHRRDPGGGL